MAKVKISELKGAPLDWAVAHNLNGHPAFFAAFGAKALGRLITQEVAAGRIAPSTDWAQGGPLIDKFGVELSGVIVGRRAALWSGLTVSSGFGDTNLIAAMRAIVAAHTEGDTVDVPDELVEGKE